MSLVSKKCTVCQVGDPGLVKDEIYELIKEVPNWELIDQDRKIQLKLEFEDFMEAIEFINQVAKLAEQEGHHPDLELFDYKFLNITLWTHKIKSLHENDFILAAKIDSLL